MFDSPLKDYIYILSIKYCDLYYLNYVHHLRNLFYLHILLGLLGLVALLGFGSMYVML
jgi:hypothetical protein